MSLDRAVRRTLEERSIPYALIGAHALSVYGVVRSTRDIDLLTVDVRVLEETFWKDFADPVTIGHGDAMDPLAGVVRIVRDPEQVDVIVGRWKFEQAILERSREFAIGDERIRVPTASDLVLLKLAAGGPQDLWDIHALANRVDKSAIIEDVDQRIDSLPGDAARLWQRIRQEWV